MKKTFQIAIPTINRADLLNKALEAYQSRFPNTKIIVLDNGFNQNIDNYPNVKKIRVTSADGFGFSVAASWNRLCNIVFIEATHALVLNDDVILDCTETQIQNLIENENFDLALGNGFSSFLLPKTTFEKIGDFDEKFIRAYFEDDDYFYRLKLAQQNIIHRAWLSAKIMERSGSASKKPLLYFYAPENETRYKQKWGGLPHHEKFKTPFNA